MVFVLLPTNGLLAIGILIKEAAAKFSSEHLFYSNRKIFLPKCLPYMVAIGLNDTVLCCNVMHCTFVIIK